MPDVQTAQEEAGVQPGTLPSAAAVGLEKNFESSRGFNAEPELKNEMNNVA